MRSNTPLAKYNILTKVLIVLGVILTCALLIVLTLKILLFFFLSDGYELNTQIILMKITQVIQSVFIFIIPALVLSYLISTKPLKFLGLSTRINYKIIIASIIALVAALPLMDLLVTWNYYLEPPQFLKGFWEWSKAQELKGQEATRTLLEVSSFGGLAFNFFLVCILAAFSEELFFRGLLLGALCKTTKRKNLSIWIIAILFSTIHMQFLGFFPRLLLGALFGYLFIWTGSIWPSTLAHLTNNTIALIQFMKYGNEALTPPSIETNYTLTNCLLAFGGCILFAVCCMYIYKTGSKRKNGEKRISSFT
ncbi:MAG: type II CAAX endopeptidase family protein [Bacteroidales bacterium]|nr:type II CAAX endopeptidase family protein [Bacteroidales bacterium]